MNCLWSAISVVLLCLDCGIQAAYVRHLGNAINDLRASIPTVTAPPLAELPKAPTEPTPADAVRAQFDAYEAAGFSPDRARDLVQESMIAGVKRLGGWQP